MSHTSVKKVKINGQTYYIKFDMIANETDLFKILLMSKKDENDGWTGTYTYEMAEESSRSLYQCENVYITNIKKCFLGKDSDQYRIDLMHNPNDGTATLSWKKRDEDFFQEQGSLKLQKASGCKNAIVDYLMDDNNILRTVNERMIKQADEIQADLELCKYELAQFLTSKISAESSLYGKFADLLNAKKQRIQLLEEELSKYVK